MTEKKPFKPEGNMTPLVRKLKATLETILRGIRYKQPATIEEAWARFLLIDQIALEALEEIETHGANS